MQQRWQRSAWAAVTTLTMDRCCEQFVVFENVLDKKRLRQIFLGIFGVFSTLVPLMLAFNSDGADAIHYASFSNRPEIYAFNSAPRTYTDNVEFCANHWLRPAVFRSIEELQAMHFLTRGKPAFIGAQRARPFREGEPPADFVWDTASVCPDAACDLPPWWIQQDEINDLEKDEAYLYFETSDDGPEQIRFDATNSNRAMLCMASSLEEIKGVLPPIRNLGASPVVVRSLATSKTAQLKAQQLNASRAG